MLRRSSSTPCASSKASLDPSGAFQVNLLFYILSTMEDHILSETEVLEDTAVRALAAAHLTDYLNCNVGGSHASAFLDLQRHEGTHVPSENNHVSTLILETLACFARDGVVAPLSGKHKRGSHQLITRDFLRTALQSCIVSIIQQREVYRRRRGDIFKSNQGGVRRRAAGRPPIGARCYR